MGYILENIVYLEFIRRGYEVHIGKIGDAEVDFIAIGVEGKEYYQSTIFPSMAFPPLTSWTLLFPLSAIKPIQSGRE